VRVAATPAFACGVRGKWMATLAVVIMLSGWASGSVAEEAGTPSRRSYVSALLGNFEGPAEIGDFGRESGWRSDNGVFLGFGLGGEVSRYCSVELELVGWNAGYRRRGEGQSRSFTIVSETGSLVFKLALPIGPLRPYLGGAAGVSNSGLRLDESRTDSKKDRGICYQLLAGTDFLFLRRQSLGVEFRKTFLRADFGQVTGGEHSIGGNVLALAYRYWYP